MRLVGHLDNEHFEHYCHKCFILITNNSWPVSLRVNEVVNEKQWSLRMLLNISSAFFQISWD